jgi:protein phosphatase PTC6
MMSDTEVIDLLREADDPRSAAERILKFAEDLGGDDNATAIIAPLAGWGKIQGSDQTRELREYRLRQAGMFTSMQPYCLLNSLQLVVNDRRGCDF